MKLALPFKVQLYLPIALLCCFFSTAYSQLTGTINIPGDYATITEAVDAINASGVGTGGVIFNVAANYKETITQTISLTATGTATNPIVFQKKPVTTGTNPLIMAYANGTGTPATAVQDGIWRLVGSDYVTIDGIDVSDSANTTNPATMEYGYGLYKASSSNGCQNVTIRNCIITLNNINNATGIAPMVDGSAGIIVMNALPTAATAALTPVTGGTNSFNRFYKNTIRNCNTGIALIGYAAPSPYTLADTDNDVGGNSPATGNTIINYGGAAAAANPAAAIRTLAQYELNVSYNTINNNDGTGSNHPNALRGIYINTAASASSKITYNTVTIQGGGTTQTITGIENASGSSALNNTVDISNNVIVNSTYTTATTGGFYGINNTATPATLAITNNKLSNNSSSATTTGFMYGISNSGAASTVSLSGNEFSGNSTAALTTGLFSGIYNSASAPVVNITSNVLAGNSTSAVSGVYYAIYNSGTVTTAININQNSIGTASLPAINFTAANSGSQVFIYNLKGAGTAALSVSNNTFYNVLYSTAGSGGNTCILNTAATLSQAVNNNTFNNLNVNTAGNLTLISNSVAVPATGTQDVNNNAIQGTFSKAAGGTVTFFTSTGVSSAAGSVTRNNNNNFSNVTVTGATAITGWVNTDAGTSTKTIQNNTFSNWTAGTGTVTAMSVNLQGSNNASSGNSINNISGGGTVNGIATGSGNDNVFQNTIHTLSTTGASTVTGIAVTSGTSKNIYSNKIYNLVANNAAGSVYGIAVSGSTSAVVAANIYNNLIGDLRAPVTSLSDAIRGISITSTRASSSINVYYNTIYLNAVSSGALFGTSGVYHAASATATTATLTLINNIITNTSTPNGSGLTVAYRRSNTSLPNYTSASGNNLFYAGAPGTNRLIFYDGTNADPTLTTYKTRVAARDEESVTEDLLTSQKFLSLSGSSVSFLHLDPAKPTLAESGGVNIQNFTNDYELQIRQENPGYTGTGTAPDIGADEFNGIQSVALSGTVLVGAGQSITSLTSAGGLFAGINSLGLSGNLVVKVTSDLAEDGSNFLYQWVEQGTGSYTLTIQPDASSARTVSGSALTGLIRLNGAKRVTFDGSNGTGSIYLTFRNTNTAGTTGTAFTFINGATNNTIRYCGVEAYANATNGVILFGASTVAGGNSSNTISNCNINAAVNGNAGNVAVYSAGTASRENTANTIQNNNIYNYRDRGLDISSTGSTAWIILRNSFYNGDISGAISYAASTTLHGIRIAGGSGYSIRNNYVGGNAPLASGTNAVYSSSAGPLSFQAILLTTSSATPVSEIKANTIASVSVSSVPTSSTGSSNTFIGIETNGSGINIGGITAGDGNRIGSNTSNGSVLVTTTTTSTSNRSQVKGINCQSTGGLVAGNQVAGMDVQNGGSAPGPSTVYGIYVNAATAPSQVINNLVGSTGTGAASNSIRVLSGSTSTSTVLNGITIGSAVTSAVQVSGNTVQNMSYQSTTAAGSLQCIVNTAGSTAVITFTNNTVTYNTTASSTGSLYAIYNSGASTTLTISNNTVSGNACTLNTSGSLFGIYNNAAPKSLTVSNNIITGNTSTATTGTLYGVYMNNSSPAPVAISMDNNTFSTNSNSTSSGVMAAFFNGAAATSLSVTGNTVSGNTTSSTAGLFYAVYNTGAVTGTINLNANNIGTSTSGAITFNAANSGAQSIISNTAGTSTAALSISNNNFYNIVYAQSGTGSNTYVVNSAATLSQAINSNTFTSLNVNTSGSITFLSNSVVVPATGTQNVNNNSIAGGFTKRVGGTVTLFTSSAASASGSVINNNNNNFSGITVPSTTVIAGWINIDAGSSTKTIQDNTFSNWTGGTGTVTVLTVNLTGTNNSTKGNVISSIAGAGAVTGISTVAGNDNIYSNIINSLSTSGAAAVTAIAIAAGTTKNVYKNKLYDLSTSNATGTVNGILVSGGTTVNIYNNLIGDLRATIANSSTDVIRGISITSTTASSTCNVYFNTLYINAGSSGTNFSTSGVYHAASATSTTAVLNARNNSITNTSTPKGTGLTVAYRRSGTALNNYASTSNNNLFYAGTPGTNRLIFHDGTNADQTLAAYKTRVTARDAQSVTEDLTAKFLSTSGSSSVFLHMSTAIASTVESGAVNIAGFTEDFDGQVRAGNPGYSGTSTYPDIGADEIFGIENVPPIISYTLLGNTTSTANRAVTDVSITDASGISNTAGTKPRIYYKRFTDANVWLDNTSSTNGWKFTEATSSGSPYTFTINYSLLYGGSAATAGVIQYFIVAQDLATITNVAVNSGTFSSNPASVALTAAAFPAGGTINSYTIPFSGIYNVGKGEVFTSLTKADGLFGAVNSAGLMGNTTFNITSDIAEDGTYALGQWAESGAGNYTMTIRPDAPAQRVVSGSVATGLIRLDGTDRLTIDGSNEGGGSYLSFRNTYAAGATGTAFTLINAATNNVIRHCIAEAYTGAANGVVLFSTSSLAGGNSNNLVDSCTIHATVSSKTGSVAVYSAGTAGNENANNTISNNIVYDYRDGGLEISATGSSGWTISGNSFYNGDVARIIDYSSSVLYGIHVLGGSGYSVLNNYIGGNDVQASGDNAVYASPAGALSFSGISVTTSSAAPASFIRGNTVAGITLSAVPAAPNSTIFTGIETAGSGINIGGAAAGQGNTIGSATGNGSVTVATTTSTAANTSLMTGIRCASSNGLVIGNQIAGIDVTNNGSAPAPSFFQGIYVDNAAPPAQVNNNVIGSAAAANSIRILPASASAGPSLTGIEIGTSVNAAVQVAGNAVLNISNLSTVSSGSFTGINNTATASGAVITINRDTIQNVGTAANPNAGSAVYAGIVSGSASVISNNLISSITLASTGVNAQVAGISVSGAYAHTISGNVISNLSTASNKAAAGGNIANPSGFSAIGIVNAATAAGQVISNNTLTGLSAMSGAGISTVVTGIAVRASGSGNIFSNRLSAFTNLSTGGGAGICGITAIDGSFNVYNNTIRISNAPNTNGMQLYGVVHSAGSNWNYYHNSVRITGNATGTAVRSAAFLSPVNGPFVLRNNIFYNIRTGTGSQYAVSNLASSPASWPASASDYNNLYSTNPGTVGEWGSGAGKTFAQWKSSSGGDAHSISNTVSFVTSTYDLEPDSATNCALNNSGTPITTPVLVNTDINNRSRSGANPDLGAYEFNYAGFVIVAGSNSPVCAGDSIDLTVDPGNAVSPAFSWRNPAGVVISTLRNPSVASVAGRYKVTVTDVNGCSVTDSTQVAINALPTARITAVSSVCDSGYVNLNISVTGTGLISGTLSNGDLFSGNAPLIVLPVFVIATTSFSISDLSDGSCAAIPGGLPDTVTVAVTRKGEWLGATINWSDPVNWCGGLVPTSSTDVSVPADAPRMPTVSDSAFCRSLTISTGATLTVAATGTLNIAGTLTNSGVYLDNGTTRFNGASGQQSFSGVTTFNRLTVGNSGSLLLPAAITVKSNLTLSSGVLNANNFNISVAGNWINTASATAFTAGTGTVSFNGSTAQSIGGSFVTPFNHLTIASAASTVSLGTNASVAGNLLLSAGLLDIGSYTVNRTTAGGTLTVANNATLKIGGTGSFPLNYASVNLVVASTVEYGGTNQTVTSQLYGNLRLSSSAGAAVKTFPATALTVAGNLSSTVGTGTSVQFSAASNIAVGGNVSIGASTAFNGGSYSHSIGGGWVNNGTFNGNTGTITFTGSGAVVSGAGIQNFNNLTVAGSGISFTAGSVALTGNLATTGSGGFTQAAGATLVMNGTNTTISGAGILLNNLSVNGSVIASSSFTVAGNVSVSGSFTSSSGTVIMSGSAKTLSGTGSTTFFVLNITGSATTASNFGIASGLIVDGSFSASAGTATFTGTSTLSGTANLYNVTLNGTSLKLSTSAVLGVAGVLAVTNGGLDVATSGPNTVNFNGSAQSINSIAYSNLVLSNGGVKTAAGAISTAYDITIASGTTFDPSSYTHAVYGNWINNGSFLAGSSSVQFSGPANKSIRGNTTFNILTVNTGASAADITLQSNVTASVVNMISGRILTGTSILTITNTRSGNGIILGSIQRSHAFTAGVAYAFESPNNSITFSAVSGVSSITVSVAKGSISDFPFGGSISRAYTIQVPAGTYNATLRLHYENDELNGNNESSMVLWRNNGSSWGSAGKTANDTAANYVEQSGLTSIVNRWTASGSSNLVQWNGSVSSDWNNPANWTVLQGTASAPPSPTDIVDLGTAAFTYQPTITSNVTVKNIAFGSVQAVTLSLGSGGTLTTLGDIDGDWTANAKHAILVNNQTLTVSGNLILSDGVNGHAIDLTIGSGTVTALNSLTESGGANITFTGAGTLNVYENFMYSSGTFTAGGGTVIYGGSKNQEIAQISYYNLVVNKSAALATMRGTVSIAGSLLVSSGELDNFSATTIAGDVTIAAGGIFKNNAVLHVQGNWNNNGTYQSNGASIFFDGSGLQTISASTFNNLNINKPSGTAVLTGEVMVTGDFSLTSGIFDFQTYNITRDVVGGTALIADATTGIIGGNNGPVNFGTKSIGLGSTIIYNGLGTQYISSNGISFGNVIFRNGGNNPKLLVTPAVIKGNLTIENGATLDGSSFTISLEGNWNNNGTYMPSTSNVIMAGVAKTLNGNTTFYRSSITGSYSVLSDIVYNKLLEITSSGSLTSYTGIATTVHGDLINRGVLITTGSATFTGNVLQNISLINFTTNYVNIVNFTGSVSPVLNSTAPVEFNIVHISNTGGVNPTVGWTIYDSLVVSSGASYNGGQSTHNLLGAVTNNGTITSTGTLNFAPAKTTGINLGSNFSSSGTVIFAGTGAITLSGAPIALHDVVISNTNSAGVSPSSGWTIDNDLSINSSSALNAGIYTYIVGDDIVSNGIINSGSSTFVLNGTGLQEISTNSPFYNLTISKTVGTVVLSSDVAVNRGLTFIAGQIQTGSNVLILPSTATVTGASQITGWVNGRLRKSVAAGSTNQLFEVGDALKYTPVSVQFSGVAAAGNLTASATAGDHPAIGSAMINTSKSVNRFWTLTNSGIAYTDYSAAFNFTAADIDSGASASSFGAALYNGSSWSLLQTVSADTTSVRVTGVRAFGDVAAGEVCNAGGTISYPDSVFCSNAGIVQVTITGNSTGTFSAPAGLAINPTTGAINLASSTPGLYVVTYTVAANGSCPVYVTTARVGITAAPSAAISYAGSPYCRDAGTAAVLLTGTSGGVYSSTAGLSVDSVTGIISLASSTPGTYTVTYTIAATGSCSRYQATTPVTITDPPSADIDYTGSPYCSSSGIVTVTRTGTPGGIYRATAGLSIDTITGSINTGTSTAGTYTITYTIAAANGCAQFIDSALVAITPSPSATISYAGNPFCNVGGIATVTLTGTAGGTFGSTAGLSINVNSGDINTGASLPGTYTVTYTIVPADGCGLFRTTTNVTINISGTWTGAVSSDWNTAENWQCNSIPVFTTNVTIPGGLSTYPVVSTGTSAISDLAILPGASLIVTGGATLQIRGGISNSGTFDAGNGIIEMNGSAAQTIPAAAFAGNTIRSLRINNESGVTLAGTLNITNVLAISGGSLASGGYLTLKSSVAADARVASITSAAAIPISGNVTVERYIPGGRKYRLLTSAVTTSNSNALVAGQELQSIWGNWQQGGNTSSHNGTFITGGSSADGFDQQTTNASLFTYDQARRLYTGFTTANGRNTKYTPLKAGVAYYMFVYGDRTNTIFTPAPDYTVLRSTGTLTTGNQVYSTGSAIPLSGDTGKFTLLGNPFASAINWATLPKTDLENTYWGWDPNLSGTGGYLTVNASGAVILQAPFSGVTGLNQYIQQGQGFFVKAAGPSPQLTIREQDKVANFNGNAFGTPITANTLPLIAVNLQYGSGSNKLLADGVVVAFDSGFSNSIGREDAAKLANSAESMAILNQNTLLSIDARKMPRSNDTVFLQLSRLSRPQYTLQIFAKQLEDSPLDVYLEDRYLNSLQPLSLRDTNTIGFDVSFSNPASYDANRFRIVFHSSVISLPVKYVSVQAFQQDKDIRVNWSVAEENGIQKYEIQKSVNGTDFFKAGEVEAGNNNRGSYRWLDVNPVTGANYYRLRALQQDGNSFLSKTVLVNIRRGSWNIRMFPNPVRNKQIHIRSDAMEKGTYTILLYNVRGEQVTSFMISHEGGKLNKTIDWKMMLPSGMYYLEIGNDEERYRQTIFIE